MAPRPGSLHFDEVEENVGSRRLKEPRASLTFECKPAVP
jgi:hypothetical protein